MLSYDNPTTRERSLRAALEVVRAGGLPELTTRAIARRSGLTQPAIYRHFSGVDELVVETLATIRELFMARLAGPEAEGATATQGLMKALETFLDFALTEPHLYDALFLQPGARWAPQTRVGWRGGGNIFGVMVERATAWSREVGAPGTGPVTATLTLMAQAQGLILLYRQGRFGSEGRFREAYRRSMEDLLRGLSG